MKTKKILIRWFVNFDNEEKFLNEQSQKGWDFWHTNGVIYRFKACKPGEYIYQIDFDEKKSAIGEDYVVFRNSCGDTFVHQWKNKIYLPPEKFPWPEPHRRRLDPHPESDRPSPASKWILDVVDRFQRRSRLWYTSFPDLHLTPRPGQTAPENEQPHQTAVLKQLLIQLRK